MNPHTYPYPVYNYTDIFSEYFFYEGEQSLYTCPEHVLIFVFSGELEISCGDIKKIIHKGDYIFLRKDIHTMLCRKTTEDGVCGTIFLAFNRNFLCSFYHRMNKKSIPAHTHKFSNNIIELPRNPYMESLYISLQPYFELNVKPLKQIIELKTMEALFSLLLTDERFYSCLFGFMKHSKLWIPLSENFSRLSSNPRQCMVTRKLETSYIIRHNKSYTKDIYMEAAYKNVFRFIRPFKEIPGLLPYN